MMEKKNKSASTEKDKYKEGRENQNIRDFNPSQYVEENDVEKKNQKKSDKKSDDEAKA